ncbi:MAG: pilus assembly protein PilM [Clostridia bacterium]|nr:pilus assembly protein PilM [Clostridia bacterium]
MAAKVLNIEVGKRLIKVCVSEKKGKNYTVSDSFTFPTPEGSVLDGQVISEVTLGDKLMGELSNRDIKAVEVFFSVGSSKIATREVTMPAVKDDQIKSIVETNASDYLPIDVSRYAIDAILLERTDDECRVLVIAVPSIIIESYIALADYTGLVIKALDFSGNSQYQVLKGVEGDGVNMYVNVDTDSSSVTFVEDGQLLLQRFLPIGGEDMITRYMALREMEDREFMTALSELNETADDIAPTIHAMRKKHDDDHESSEAVVEEDASAYGVESDSGESPEGEESFDWKPTDENPISDDSEVTEVLEEEPAAEQEGPRPDPWGDEPERDTHVTPKETFYPELDDMLTRIVGGIVRSVDFFQGSYTDKPIEKIVITGSCGHIRGLKTRLFETLGADTYWLEEVKELKSLANSVDDISIYINCLGSRVAPLNLLPSDYIARTGTKKKAGVNGDNFGIITIAACALIALALSGYMIGMNLYKKSQLDKVNAQIDQLAYAEKEYQDYVLYKNGDTELQAFIDGYINPNSQVKDFLEEMEAKMPTNITVLSASFTEKGVSFNITCPGFEEAANVIRQFRSFETIDVIECSSMAKSGGEGSSSVTFNMICNYHVEETTTAAPETTAEDVTE